MRKEYKEFGHIVTSDANDFPVRVANRIAEYQAKGMEVEVQYASNGSMFTAVVLGFKKQHEWSDMG